MLLPLFTLLASTALATPVPDPFAIYRPGGEAPKAEAVANVQGSFHRFSVPLQHTASSIKRERAKRSGLDLDADWLIAEAARVDNRYNPHHDKRQQNGVVQLQDNGKDASYAGQVSVGTPAQTFPVILDTGSADFWIESSKCPACPGDRFDESKSSTYKSSTEKFSITYGSGGASGLLGQDTVSLGGYAQSAQTFALVDTMKEGLITTAVTGIMGLAFQSLSYSRSQPWWQAVSGTWEEKLFAFYLKRYRDVPGAANIEADGGVANFGYLDSSLYSGSISYVPLAANPQYWHISMARLSSQGTDISLSGADQVAIDTGTTLIGGPERVVSAIYAAIPGSKRMSGNLANYYEYPCSTTIDFKMKFGDHTIDIGNPDFDIGHSSSNGPDMCTGGVFVQVLSAASPVQWIVGATALKNTYTVFRSEPGAVGFASLAGAEAAPAASAETVVPTGDIPGAPAAATNGTTAAPSASITGTTTGSNSSSSSSASSATVAKPSSSASVVSGDSGVSTVWVAAPAETNPSAAGANAESSQPENSASRIQLTPLLLLAALPLLL